MGAEEKGMERTKILVVEDNEDNRRILVLRLQHEGQFAVREATTGQEALDYITREPPDLVFLNLKLPVLDGWETARRIRALPAPLNQLPIIAVTAYAMAGDREKALAAGCDEYIAKPIVNPGEILDKLQRLLSRRGRPGPAGGAPAPTKT
jgi:two-component system, cell cycle response regulator DivK